MFQCWRKKRKSMERRRNTRKGVRSAGDSMPCQGVSCTGCHKISSLWCLEESCASVANRSQSPLCPACQDGIHSVALCLSPSCPVSQTSHLIQSLVCMTCSITSVSLTPIMFSSRILGPQGLGPANLPFTFHTSDIPPGLGCPSIPCPSLHWDLQPNCSLRLTATVR